MVTRKLKYVRSLLAILLFASSAHGQARLIPRPPPVPDYVLGAGDELVLQVGDMEEVSNKPMRIDPNGFIDLPMAGRIQAGGLTVDQFKTALAAKLGKYITNPQISVNLTDHQSRPISIIGSVNSPGVHQLQGPRRLIEVLSLAGGVKGDAGSRVILTRENKWGLIPLADAHYDPTSGFSTASVSLDDLLSSKRPGDNILISPNDVISIPKAEVVYVVGNVRKAGGFQLTSHVSVTLIQAVALAGGLERDAASSRARIIRPAAGGDGKPLEIPVDIPAIFAGKSPDVPLFGNDVLYVPNSVAKSGTRRAAEAILQAATGAALYRF